jgi:hypothetical protein
MDTMSKLAHHCPTPVHRDDLTVSATPGLDARVHHKVRPGRVSVVFGQPRLLSRRLGMCIDEYNVKTRTELPNTRVRVPRSTVQMARMRGCVLHTTIPLIDCTQTVRTRTEVQLLNNTMQTVPHAKGPHAGNSVEKHWRGNRKAATRETSHSTQPCGTTHFMLRNGCGDDGCGGDGCGGDGFGGDGCGGGGYCGGNGCGGGGCCVCTRALCGARELAWAGLHFACVVALVAQDDPPSPPVRVGPNPGMGGAVHSRVHAPSGQPQCSSTTKITIVSPERAHTHVSFQTCAQTTPHRTRIAGICGTRWDMPASRRALTMFCTAFKRLLVTALQVSVRQQARDGRSPATDGCADKRAGADKRRAGGHGYNPLQERVCRQNSK